MPTKRRNVSATAVLPEQGKAWYLVDCGEGTQQQLLHTKLSLNTLAAVCITHIHGDHCYGLPGLLSSASMNGRTAPLVVLGPASLGAFFDALMQHCGFYLSYPVVFVPVDGAMARRQMPCDDFLIDVVPLSHRVPSYAYIFTEKNIPSSLNTARLLAEGIQPGVVWGQLQQGQDVTVAGRKLHSKDYVLPPRRPRKIIVAGDNDTPACLQAHMQGVDVLVHEATYTADIAAKVGRETGHSHAGLVAQFASEVNLPNLVLTHFSPRYTESDTSPCLADIAKEAREVYTGQLFLADDFAQYQLSTHGVLQPQQV